jgi:hypothetical protein
MVKWFRIALQAVMALCWGFEARQQKIETDVDTKGRCCFCGYQDMQRTYVQNKKDRLEALCLSKRIAASRLCAECETWTLHLLQIVVSRIGLVVVVV